MNAATNLLSRLQHVKRTGPGKWSASCPTREDKSPSLAVRELDDGTLLLHDFGGDSVEAIVGAIGLGLSDLFPPRPTTPGAGRKPERRPFIPVDVFEIARREIGVVAILACDMHAQRTVSDADHDRLLQAVQTLDRIAEVSYAR
jgi:hypothetical protein